METEIATESKVIEMLAESLYLTDFIHMLNENADLDDEVWNKNDPDPKYYRWYSTRQIAQRIGKPTADVRRAFTALEGFGALEANRKRNRIDWAPVTLKGFQPHPVYIDYLIRITDGINN